MSGPAGWDDVPTGPAAGSPGFGGPAGGGPAAGPADSGFAEAPAGGAPIGTGWDEAPAGGTGWEQATSSGSGWDPTDGGPTQMPTVSSPSQGLLFAAIGVAGLSVVLGLLLGRDSGPVALVAWFLAGVVAIVLMALHQQQDLKAAMSVYYVADDSSMMLRWITLALVGVGVVVNSYLFAQWVATR